MSKNVYLDASPQLLSGGRPVDQQAYRVWLAGRERCRGLRDSGMPCSNFVERTSEEAERFCWRHWWQRS